MQLKLLNFLVHKLKRLVLSKGLSELLPAKAVHQTFYFLESWFQLMKLACRSDQLYSLKNIFCMCTKQMQEIIYHHPWSFPSCLEAFNLHGSWVRETTLGDSDLLNLSELLQTRITRESYIKEIGRIQVINLNLSSFSQKSVDRARTYSHECL